MRPEYSHDFYSDAVIADPYPHYKELRDAGAAVWLTQHDAWAFARFKDVRDALRNPVLFSSASGVALNEPFNANNPGNTLQTDAPIHTHMRSVMAAPLGPREVVALRARLSALAEAHVEKLVARKSFDAVEDLAHFLPLSVVTELVGLPEAGKANMLPWAAAMFNVLGSMNERAEQSFPIALQAINYLNNIDPKALSEGSWGARLFERARAGDITNAQAHGMLVDYTGPALDTTINAMSSAIWLFAQNPEQWDILKENHALIPNAINEAIRLESPIRAFSRLLTQDLSIEGVDLKAGERVLLVYASANRDERRWGDPERFDIRRPAQEQLGFGGGPHACAGMHLARLEIHCVLEALLKRVSRIEIEEERREPHNVLRGLKHLRVRTH